MLRVVGVDFDEHEHQRIAEMMAQAGYQISYQCTGCEQILEAGWSADACDLFMVRDSADIRQSEAIILRIHRLVPDKPIFVITEIVDEIRFNSLLNIGASRVFTLDLLEAILPGCLSVYWGQTPNAADWRNPGELTREERIVSLHESVEQQENTAGRLDHFESVLDNLSSIAIILDIKGDIVFFNRQAERISGYTFQEVKGRSLKDLFLLPEEEAGVMRAFDKLKEGYTLDQHQNSWLTRSGGKKQLEWSNTLLRDQDGTPAYFVGIGLDISEDFERYQMLRESEERFSKIFHNNSSGMAVLDYRDGRMMDANHRFLNQFNFRLPQIIGKSLHELGLLLPADRWDSDFLVKIQQTSFLSIERKIMLPGSSLMYMLLAFNIVELSSGPFILLTVQDLTEQMVDVEQARRFNLELEGSILERSAALEAVNRELKSEIAFRKALESSTQRLIQIIWETPDIVAISDLTGRLQYLNKAGRQVLGINESDPVSHLSVYSVYSQEFKEYILTHIAPQIEEQGVWRGETDFYLPGGRVIPVSQAIIGHRDQNNQIQFYSSVARDITDLQRASQELRLAYEKEKELGRLHASFFSMTSHQFRTPLSTILSSAELLQHYGEKWTAEKRQLHTQRIQDSTMRLSRMLSDILEYSKIEARQGNTQIEAINLEDLCLKIMNDLLLADQEQHSFSFNCDKAPCMVYSDKLSLELVIENLLSNAIKYSPNGTQVTVKIEEIDRLVLLQVRDEGIGISPSEQRMIFEPFQRGSNVFDTPGSGLGLMIVRKSLELIKGEISLRSELGVGTEITVQIPDLRA